MKALIEWHALYDSLTLIRDELELEARRDYTPTRIDLS